MPNAIKRTKKYSMDKEDRGQVIIYQAKNGETSIEVKLENETVWLDQYQMAELFDTDRTSIVKHMNNIYRTGELDIDSTCAKIAQVQIEGNRTVKRQISYYNLDMIISIGYRVNSKRGTQFRIWANKVLKEYLIKGYAINQQAKLEQLEDLKKTVQLLSNVIANKELTIDEANGLLHIITDYTYALDTLDKYDYQQLEVEATTHQEKFRATYANAMETISLLQYKFDSSDLFGNEKDHSSNGKGSYQFNQQKQLSRLLVHRPTMRTSPFLA